MRPSAAEPDDLGVVGKPIQTESIAIQPVGYARAGCLCWRLRWKKNQKNRPPIAAAAMITTAFTVG